MSAASLRSRLDRVIEAYRAEFAGQPRKTRDVARLDELTKEARAVAHALERRIGPLRADERALFEKTKTWLGTLTTERSKILAEKAFPERTPARQFIGEPGGRANVYMAMLRARFHAPAREVDVALLAEVIAGLEVCQRDMIARTPDIREKWMLENFDGVAGNLVATRAQADEIAQALATGMPTERKQAALQLGADLEGLLAWEDKFIRADARRPARLRHASEQLRALAERVRELGQLTGAEGDAIARMNDRADVLDAELRTLLDARAAAGDSATIAALDREAASINKVYQANFAGKPRDKVDLALLRRVLYRGCSIAIQATDLSNANDSAANNEARVRTRKKAYFYEDEEKAVGDRQAE